ncbi:MAG: hypothetical protein WC421_05705 [Elusimicrobiales bacterium]
MRSKLVAMAVAVVFATVFNAAAQPGKANADTLDYLDAYAGRALADAVSALWEISPQVKADPVSCGAATLSEVLGGISDPQQLMGTEFDTDIGINGPGTGYTTRAKAAGKIISGNRLGVQMEVEKLYFRTRADGKREYSSAEHTGEWIDFSASFSEGKCSVDPGAVRVMCRMG